MRRRTLLGGSIGLLAAWPLVPGWALAQDGALDGREPRDPSALTAEERRHVPVLVLPTRVRAARAFDLVVQVGVEPHPMTASHHVEWIEVTVGEERAFLATLAGPVAYPIVRVPLTLGASGPLTVRARCNLHGTWRTRRTIEVG